MEAEISARLLDEITGLTQITVKNKSRIMWGSTGSRAATLLAEWSDVTGNYRGHVVLPLPAPVPSGQDIRMTVRLDGHGEAPTGQLRLHVNQRDVGVFTGTGRSNVLCLPCSEAAFTRLATLGEAS
jgi:hypothetical protein